MEKRVLNFHIRTASKMIVSRTVASVLIPLKAVSKQDRCLYNN